MIMIIIHKIVKKNFYVDDGYDYGMIINIIQR